MREYMHRQEDTRLPLNEEQDEIAHTSGAAQNIQAKMPDLPGAKKKMVDFPDTPKKMVDSPDLGKKMVDLPGIVAGNGNNQDLISRKSGEDSAEVRIKRASQKKGTIINGTEIVSALNKTAYGQSLIKILEDSGLEYTINIQTNNNGKFGDPKKVEKDGTVTGYQLNFQKYSTIELAGTRYDHSDENEYYGGIAAHDIIDVATPEGISVNKTKDEDWANPDSDFRKLYHNWTHAKAKNKEAAKTDFFQYMIDNYEKVGMDAEYKFRNELQPNTLDTKIGELSQDKQKEGNNPNLTGKTPRDVYTKGIK